MITVEREHINVNTYCRVGWIMMRTGIKEMKPRLWFLLCPPLAGKMVNASLYLFIPSSV